MMKKIKRFLTSIAIRAPDKSKESERKNIPSFYTALSEKIEDCSHLETGKSPTWRKSTPKGPGYKLILALMLRLCL
jgi:hypothetical protein